MTTVTESRSLQERVVALEETVKHLASKEDLERVRTELLLAIERVQSESVLAIERVQAELLLAIERVQSNSDRSQARQTRWTVGTIIATGALAVAAIKLL